MVCEPPTMVICLDIGMTRSGACWKTNSMDWADVFEDPAKVPTSIAYNTLSNDDRSVAWGKGCANLGPGIRVYECFKSSIDEDCLSNTNLESQPDFFGGPQRWMQDYIHSLVDHIVDVINSKPDTDLKNASIRWVFTVPGCWREFPTVANFKRIATNAIFLCFGERESSEIVINTTEAQASAYCLLRGGASLNGYVGGNTVLSCDIGGATTDIAISQIDSPGSLRTSIQLDMHPTGVADIAKRFGLHIQQTLESAGVPNSIEIVQALSRARFLDSFTEKWDDRWELVVLPPALVTNLQPLESKSPTGTKIQVNSMGKKVLLIHKNTLIEMFAKFVEDIEATIDHVINELAKEGTNLTVIGFCGGGSLMRYPVKRLRMRYQDKITILDHTNYPFRPELATLIGNRLLWDQQVVIDFCNRMCFGIKDGKDNVTWGELSEIQTPLDFQTAYAMEVIFPLQTHSIRPNVFRPKIKHSVVAVPRTPSKLHTFSAASLSLGSKTWDVQIDLGKVKHLPGSICKRYNVICKISGVWEIQIVAETGDPARNVDCIMTCE